MSFNGCRKGKLIVFEGIDGTGKSTQIRLLSDYLTASGQTVVQSFEPTRGKWGKQLRDSATTGRLSLEEEVELFLKDRREHVEQLIAPALKRGDFVLLDRYYLSMMAYQSARGISADEIRIANEEFAPIPDAVIWLDIPIQTALNRIGSRGAQDHFESEEHLTHCRQIFSSIHDPWMLRVDGDGSPDLVSQRVIEALKSFNVIS